MFQNPKEKKAAEHADNAMSDFKSAKSELKSAKNAAVSSAKDRLNDAGDEAQERVRDLRATAREAGEKVQHFLTDRREDAVHARDTAERTIRANPLASAAVAFVTGAILSRILR